MTRPPSRDLWRACVFLIALGAATHFVGLTHPREIVFDEATMGNFVSAYCCTHERIFDLHPPHGKLLIALGAKLGGYNGDFKFTTIGAPYGNQPVFALRLVPALAGIIVPPLFLLLLIELGASFPAAVLGGILAALDNALLLETKIIVWDGLLVASVLASLVCFCVAQRHRTHAAYWLAAAGGFAGLAVGCKLTGLAALGTIAVGLAAGFGIVRGSIKQRIGHAAIIAVCAVVIYAAGWFGHVKLLTQPGPADAFYTSTGHAIEDILTGQAAMVRENLRLTATHPDASAPWTWPLMKVPPYFWQGQGASQYMLGNPVVWWGSTALLVVSLVQVRRRLRSDRRHFLALAAYLISFVPLLDVKRVLFMYHYLMPLLFGLGFGLMWLDRQGWTRNGPLHVQRVSYFGVIAAAVLAFVAVSPVTYGFSVGQYDEWLSNLIRSWR